MLSHNAIRNIQAAVVLGEDQMLYMEAGTALGMVGIAAFLILVLEYS